MSTPILHRTGLPLPLPTPYLPSPSSGMEFTDAHQDETLRSLLRVLRKRKYLIAYVTLGFLFLAALVCIFLPRQYTGTATIQIGKDDTATVNLLHDAATAPTPDDLKTEMATHIAVLTNDSIALAVIDHLTLQKTETFAFKPTLMGWIDGTNARIEAERGLPLDKAPATRERLLKIFSKHLTVKNVPSTRMITVSVLYPDPTLASKIANDVVTEYISFEARAGATGQASQWLAAQLDQLKHKVELSQGRLAAYEQQTGLNTLLIGSIGQAGGAGGMTHIPILDRLDSLNQELTAAESNRLSKEAIYHMTETDNPEVVIGLASSGLPGIASSAVLAQGSGLELLQSLRQQQSATKLTYADMATKYGPKNPRLMEIGSQLTNLSQQLSDELSKINARARNDYMLAAKNEEDLRRVFTRQQDEAGKLNASTVKLQILAQEADSSRQLYDGLYSKLQEANVQAGLRATNIGIADPARPIVTPTRPNPLLYLAIGMALGVFFGISSAFAGEYFDETIKTADQLNASVQMPVLASIPRAMVPRQNGHALPKLNQLNPTESSLLITHPMSSMAESYRALRTSISLLFDSESLHTLLVTSPLVGEGKTTVAYNIAVAFAQAGKKVLLVDADMRNSRLHEMFGAGKSPGLSEVLSGAPLLASHTRAHSTMPNLSLLPSGNKPAMPAELLCSKSFRDLLSSMKANYDLIVIDSPPMLLVTDASIMSAQVDATLAVVRTDLTNRRVLNGLPELLKRNGFGAVGFILNGVDLKSVDYYYAYGHNGGGKYFEESHA